VDEALSRTTTESDARQAPAPVAFHYAQSDSFVALLHELRSSLLVSTYQANKLLAVRATGSGLSTLVRTFDRPMGIALEGPRLALGTRREIWMLRNAADIAAKIEPAGTHDACFLPRSCHVTGDVGIHELAWGERLEARGPEGRGPEGRGDASAANDSLASDLCPLTSSSSSSSSSLWLVSTRFSCLATLDEDYSFVPRWRPPFITAIAAEDRCHLNGLAMDGGRPRFASALGTTDTQDGWRADKPRGGCLIDIDSGELVARSLSMPHSPRWRRGQLWVLESGTGRLLRIDIASGQSETVVELPGFARGMAFAGPFAFVGLSKIRPTSAMDGVPLAEFREKLKCGVAAVDLRSGQIVGFLEFQTAIEEIFDVQLAFGMRFPEVVGFQNAAIDNTFVIPPNAL
jgi:hypothetical protein